MSGETENNISGWTTDTLHSHLLRLLDERAIEWNQRFDAQEQALKLAREAELKSQEGHTAVLQTRLEAMDKAVILFKEDLVRVPTDVDKQVSHLRSFHDERFRSMVSQMEDLAKSMTIRFEERDTRSEREARDNKIAVDAAFAAAKEAVAEQNKSSALAISKSEAATTKQIDQIAVLIATTNKASDDKIDDLKASQASTAITVSTLGQLVASQSSFDRESQTQRNWSTGTTVAAVFSTLSLVVAIIVAIILVVHG